MTPLKKDPLRFVLNLAYDQAMRGKGIERHADGLPFIDQIWHRITKAVGVGFPAGQALKKCHEAQGMTKEAKVKELLGAMCYIAMWIIYILENEE